MHRLGHPRNFWRVSSQWVDLSRPVLTPQPIQVPAEPQGVVIDARRTAAIVVDMQNDFCAPSGWLASVGGDWRADQQPIEPLKRFLPVLRAHQIPVLWVNWGNRPDRLNLSPSVLHVYNPDGAHWGLGDRLPTSGSAVLEKGSWGAHVIDELTVEPGDIQVDKYRMSGFWDTPLDSILRNLAVSTLLFAGVNSDQCVMATLQDANFLGYDCILLDDCCATSSPAYCRDATLYNVKQCYGFVARSTDFVRALSSLQETGDVS
jgi:ureidoacrylate peracid hydrolase